MRVGLRDLGEGNACTDRRAYPLVTRGFYRCSRNPMCLAVLTVIAGWAVLFGSLILVAYGVALFTVFSLFILRYEEPRLAQEFGEEYAAYVERVGR